MFKNDSVEIIPDICRIHCKPQKCLFVVSADSTYFYRYAQIFYKSIMENNNGDNNIGVHFHIINPDEKCFEIINSFKLANYSIEYKNLSNYVKKAYYTIPRYSMMPYFDKIYNCKHYIICDIDVAIDKDIDIFLKSVNNYNFALVLNGAIYNENNKMSYPWSSIGAALAYFKKCDEMHQFFQHYNSYVNNVFDSTLQTEHANWLIDQMALWHAYNKVAKHSSCKGISKSALIMAAQMYKGGKNEFVKHFSSKYGV